MKYEQPDYTIIQAIPAPENMMVKRIDGLTGTTFNEPVCCLALIEWTHGPSKGSKEIVPMALDNQDSSFYPLENDDLPEGRFIHSIFYKEIYFTV